MQNLCLEQEQHPKTECDLTEAVLRIYACSKNSSVTKNFLAACLNLTLETSAQRRYIIYIYIYTDLRGLRNTF